MRNMHKYEELLPREFDAEKERSSVVYIAMGPMEYHGVYNSLGIDPVKTYDICLRAVEITGGIVFPMLPVAPGGSPPLKLPELRKKIADLGENYYPSIMTSIDICEKLYRELLESFAIDLGFKICVACGGHGPARTLIKKIVDEYNGNIYGMKVIAAGSLSHNLEFIKAEYQKLGLDLKEHPVAHGGLWETAMNMGVKSEYFSAEATQNPECEKFRKYPDSRIEELKHASRELGGRINQFTAERIAEDVEETLRSIMD